MSLSLQNSQHMPELNTRNCSYRFTFLRPNACDKITSFCGVLKTHAEGNWFVVACRHGRVYDDVATWRVSVCDAFVRALSAMNSGERQSE